MNLNNITKTIQRIVGARADGIYGQETARKILAILQPQADAPSEPEQPATGKLIVIDIGHSDSDPGAINTDGIGEHDFWTAKAPHLKSMLELAGHKVQLIERTSSISAECKEINKLKPDLVLSLHFNSADNADATGSEVLHWYSSTKGAELAELLNFNISDSLGIRNRGAKPIEKGGRGAGFLSGVDAVAVILEPFFGSNADDVAAWKSNEADALQSIADTVTKFLA